MTIGFEIRKILVPLCKARVKFVIVGGVAGTLHGSDSFTRDLDICYKRDNANYAALVKALLPLKPRLRLHDGQGIDFLFDDKTLRNGLNFTLITQKGSIDLLGEVKGLGRYEDLVANAETIKLYGYDLSLVSLDDLIKAKQAAGRNKDLLHLKELEALRIMTKSSGKRNG